MLDLGRQFEHRERDRRVGVDRAGLHVPPAVDLLGEGVLLAHRVAEGLGHVSDRRLGPVGDDVGHLGAVVAAVLLVDVLDDLLAAVGLDVDVDVGRAVAFGRQEPLEEEAEGDGVGVGDAEGEAHRGVGRRAPALAEDVGSRAEVDDVPHDEEVAGEAQLVDEVELTVELLPGTVDPGGGAGAVPAGAALLDQSAEVAHLVEPVGARVGRQVGGDQGEVERALQAEGGGPLDDAGVAGEAQGLFIAGAQVETGGWEPAVDLVEAAPGPHRGHGRGEALAGDGVVVDVAGGDQVETGGHRQLGEGVVADRVGGEAVIPQLDGDVVPAEVGHQSVEGPAGRGRAAVGEALGHRGLATAGEDQPVVVAPRAAHPAQLDQTFVADPRRPLLPRQLALADRPAEQGVALRVAGEDEEVFAHRVGRAGSRQVHGRLFQGELGTEHGGQADGSRRLGEADDAVEAVVVGEGQGLEVEPGRLLGQLLGVRRAVEEREVGVAVELGVGGGAPVRRRLDRWLVLPSFPGPGGAVAPVANPQVTGAPRRWAVRECAFDVGPWHVGAVPTHPLTLSEQVFGPQDDDS